MKTCLCPLNINPPSHSQRSHTFFFPLTLLGPAKTHTLHSRTYMTKWKLVDVPYPVALDTKTDKLNRGITSKKRSSNPRDP